MPGVRLDGDEQAGTGPEDRPRIVDRVLTDAAAAVTIPAPLVPSGCPGPRRKRAAGFLMRPIGGWWFGWVGGEYGTTAT